MSQQPVARAAVMNDVARLAGVSHQTVSRVLNNHPSVRDETRERVLVAVKQLNYRPNALARGLAGRRSRVIGVVSFDTILYGPAATLLGVERAARHAGYGISIVALEKLDRAGVTEAVNRLTEQSVAGVVIIAPLLTAAAAAHSLPTGVPAVVVESDIAGDLPTISVDQVAGARLAVEHLLELGHETVWHLTGPKDWLEARDRVDGWRQALEAAGRRVPAVIVGDWSPRSGYEAGHRIGSDVTAVFCANDQQALGMLRALHERGIRVPEDVSIVGFDDIPEAEYLSPPLTTVRQDFDEVGRRCLAALLDLLDADMPDAPPHPRVAPTLMVRASSGPPA
ncbi:LacI family DNA-binding transcriptional regulator [Catellatospora citrea]|uniref:LacI family transcriptional regulator n=1 Tax=Catellatospora citrea TaxID=53366 RepID=A0A8J3P3Y4_9ACTN|nr:LacI family DNA-binding transcriptional regulator [Catellatospora citrea]RKE06212.1 LacI family transcriptional regulator [Catellatospora citrea]GIG00551.1 LacI family transcriptional regulator [Catellatospora citrea]